MRFFGTDGIRDVAGQGRLAPEHVTRLGRALVGFLATERPRVCIGRDPRPSGEELVARLASALFDAGAGEVVDLGVVPSPVVPWAMVHDGFDLGLAVSASHNPPEYNGIKPFAKGGRKLEIAEEETIERLMDAATADEAPARPPRPVDGAAEYVESTSAWLREGGDFEGFRLVVDLAAGAASTTAPRVLRALGAEVIALHEAGTRDINDACGTEHPEAWLDALARAGATAGLAFDGDADRVLVAGPDGSVLDGDDAMAVLAQDGRARGTLHGDVVVSTVMANLGVQERLAGLGVRLERSPVGDRNVAERMRATGASIGAEPSGHVVLEREGALIGDGLVAGVRVLQAAARLGRPLATLKRETPRYPQILRNVRLAERRPLASWPEFTSVVDAVEQALGERGRVVVRYSGTEPLLRIMVEGKDAAEVDAAVDRMEAAARA